MRQPITERQQSNVGVVISSVLPGNECSIHSDYSLESQTALVAAERGSI